MEVIHWGRIVTINIPVIYIREIKKVTINILYYACKNIRITIFDQVMVTFYFIVTKRYNLGFIVSFFPKRYNKSIF